MIPYIAKYRLGDNECTLVYDLHVDRKGAQLSKKQLDMFIAACKKQKAPLVIEDMDAYTGSDADIKALLPVIQTALEAGAVVLPGTDFIDYTILWGLTKHCESTTIKTINAEFRQTDLLRRRYATHGMSSEALAAFERLLQALKTVCAEIEQYQDAVPLNAYYKKVLRDVTPSLELLDTQKNKILNPQETAIFWTNYWNCMLQVLDARIVHLWYQQSLTNNHVIVYAGGEHVAALEDLLQRMGYTKVAEQGDKEIMEQVKKYRVATMSLHLKPVAGLKGLLTICQNIGTSWKVQKLNKQLAQNYTDALRKAETVDLAAVIEAR